MVLIHITVGKNQDIGSVSVCTVCFYEQMIQRFLKTCIFIIGNGKFFYFETFLFHVFDLHQIGVCQYRITDL